MMNPMQVAQNRTARLVREARTPAYTTATPAPVAREHYSVVEMESDFGRGWSRPMHDSKVNEYISELVAVGYWVSDIDHAGNCWCFKGEN